MPAAIPVTAPEVMPISATPVDELPHVPPAGVVLRVIPEPTHTAPAPDIAAGVGSTVTSAVLEQPPWV